MITEQPRVYKVSEITRQIKGYLEPPFHDIRVEGEISNFRPSSTGHYYFTLKDPSAVISAVMFRNRIRYSSFVPEDGQVVIVRGNLSVYEKRGSYQIVCESIEAAGEGKLLALLEERKKRLAAEGLFEPARKLQLPRFPSRIAVVTSPTGAAVRDIIRVLKTRKAPLDVLILPAAVQGEEAAEQIARQIRIANRYNLGDVIITGRGGGSLEDLLPFSEERVVRAIAESQIPVISAVGHETDTALSDFAADIRAATPSAAAEIVSVHGVELEKHIADLHRSLTAAIRQYLQHIRMVISRFTPEELERNFRIIVQPYLLRLDDSKETMLNSISHIIREVRHRIQLILENLKGSSPYRILKKGFALVTDTRSGIGITSASQAAVDEDITIRFYDDHMEARVHTIRGSWRDNDEKL